MELAAAVRLPTALQFERKRPKDRQALPGPSRRAALCSVWSRVAAFANGRHLMKGDLEEIRASRRWKTSWDEAILGEHGVCGTAKFLQIREKTLMTNDALIEEINASYRRLGAAMEDQARADRRLTEHVRTVRLDNAEAILEAKNERTASLYLDGLLDTDEHRRLEADRTRADLDLQHARRDIERLHLIVRLLGDPG
jgi:hypothetical protein